MNLDMSGRKVPEVGAERIREILYGAYRVIYGIDAFRSPAWALPVYKYPCACNLNNVAYCPPLASNSS